MVGGVVPLQNDSNGTRTRWCETCGERFSYPIARGNDRKHCSPKCRLKKQLSVRASRFDSAPTCRVSGCSGRATRIASGMCEKHYIRHRRTGRTDDPKRKYRYRRSGGYIRIHNVSHSLADAGGNVDEHRLVMFELLGDAPQKCHWCDQIIEWKTSNKQLRIVVDHLNEIKDDNRPENLVLSCNSCNRARGACLPFLQKMTRRGFEQFVRTATEYRLTISTEDGGFGNAVKQ